MKTLFFYLIFVVASLFSIAGFPQDREILKPDYSSIEQLIKDPNSLFYYPHMFKKYINNDTTLSLREYRMLYYGYFFQKEYASYEHSDKYDSLNIIFYKDRLTPADWKNIVRIDKQYLLTRPFELKKLNLLYLAYKHLGDTADAAIYFDKIKKIAYTILSSGDGQSETTAMHVLEVSDEYSLINMLGYQFGGQQYLTNSDCDYLTLKENPDNLKGLYFDVKQILAGYEKILGNAMTSK